MANHGDHEGPDVGCVLCASDAPRPHGTQAAVRRHERNHEPLCEPCRLERNRLARVYHHRRRQYAANQ